jgi:Recombination endonuclease VII
VTGRVRGILCWNCNIAIGQLEDDSDRARAVAEYLDSDDGLDDLARDRLVALSA